MNEKQMQEMAVSILLDEYTQLDVAQLLKEYEEDEENGELPNVPDALDESCEGMIRREFSKKKQKKFFIGISKVLSRIAMITLMLIGLCTVSVLSVKAWREPALRFVLETFDRRSFASIEGEITQTNKTPEEIAKSLSMSVPAEYTLVKKSSGDRHYYLEYIGRKGELISLTVATYIQEFSFDIENAEHEQIRINGYDAVLVKKNGYKIICLNEKSQILIELLAVNVSEKTFWKLVDSLIQ